jgi:hypothetical protein
MCVNSSPVESTKHHNIISSSCVTPPLAPTTHCAWEPPAPHARLWCVSSPSIAHAESQRSAQRCASRANGATQPRSPFDMYCPATSARGAVTAATRSSAAAAGLVDVGRRWVGVSKGFGGVLKAAVAPHSRCPGGACLARPADANMLMKNMPAPTSSAACWLVYFFCHSLPAQHEGEQMLERRLGCELCPGQCRHACLPEEIGRQLSVNYAGVD